MSSLNKVYVGRVALGGGAPVSVQSMTNTRTSDVQKTAEQIKALEDAGCDIVRVAVLDRSDAEAIKELKAKARAPLVADIHFDHRLAIISAENGIDKLRINPGNIGSDEKVKAVADCARAHNIPIRIGINSGCVEKDVLARYGGPTAEALAESALANAAMLERFGFSDIVLAVKSSSAPVTVAAMRLIAAKCDYPLHVGVTEPGGGEFAIVKSAAGIGSLLMDGIGDTIRVSLTGDPVEEVRAGIMLLRAIGIRREGLDVICCPTCGRCRNIAAHDALYERLENEFGSEKKYLRAAVMGCAVNGPGEAREADIGIAYGQTNAVIFERGELVSSGTLPGIEDEFVQRVRERMTGEEISDGEGRA